MLNKTVGFFDRAARGILGMALLFAVLFGWIGGLTGLVLGIVGVVLVATAALGMCPIYNLFDIDTREAKG